MAGQLLSQEAIALLEQLHEARGWRRLDLEEREAWRAAADDDGRPVAEIARDLLEDWAARQLGD